MRTTEIVRNQDTLSKADNGGCPDHCGIVEGVASVAMVVVCWVAHIANSFAHRGRRVLKIVVSNLVSHAHHWECDQLKICDDVRETERGMRPPNSIAALSSRFGYQTNISPQLGSEPSSSLRNRYCGLVLARGYLVQTVSMSGSLPGSRDLPASRYDLNTYWGRVLHSADIADPRTLLTSTTGLEHAKTLLTQYKQGKIQSMTPELWKAKKIVDSTLHPDTGEPVFLPFRMSCFVLSNLVVTAGMLTPNLSTTGTIAWQWANQSLNVAINSANANKSTPITTTQLIQSYFVAVGASCGVAVGLNSLVPRLKRLSPTMRTTLGRLVPFAAVASAGALNVFLMRGEEIRRGIDVFPSESDDQRKAREAANKPLQSLGKSKQAATLAVGETALSRVLNSTPIMVLPPLILVRLQEQRWLKQRPRLVLPVNLGLILVTSVFALPLALAAFPQRQAVSARSLEKEFWDKGGEGGKVEFNRGI
ncbi:hypothetical protein BAUCODRAFT_569670 [Baudoinia panamericana UAMH 10762]|uniref:Sidoreflexin n=1 Tax=Baudoinia panamericana (strain UAMH 10762) TaxID=717646 RepID=M2N057_BAUPA|nr:uncharacterized protein BAUCODRAFT_569670 [Baudoinia panamericana UAMH 10762]EMC92314.1 hypothetical protein BAUCODRAFT_569670 [Baudoinia panamericana UAMH 10762]